jgi:hypothetical protein
MIDELLPYAYKAYQAIGESLGINCIEEKAIIDCFPSAQMRLAFLERFEEEPGYLSLPADEKDLLPYLRYGLGYGIIRPSYLVDLTTLLGSFRKALPPGSLLEERFSESRLMTGGRHTHYTGGYYEGAHSGDTGREVAPRESIHYERKPGHPLQSIRYESIHHGTITAEKIIFCDGRNGIHNPYFEKLPWALSKGEALIVDIPGLPRDHIYKKGISIVPWQNDLFWVGSSYEWNFDNDQPTEAFRNRATQQLKEFLQLPFAVVDHKASLRPGTLERRPFVGWHPADPRIGIFNGMGTKGCSLAPYFARQWVAGSPGGDPLGGASLGGDHPLLPAADIARFSKILSR